MYQLEVKQFLVSNMFSPQDGWDVTVDIDAMERAKGPQHPKDKKERVRIAEAELVRLGVKTGAHSEHGRADVVAIHKTKGKYLVEVEGKSSKQKEQAMYSALGQTVLLMTEENPMVHYAIAAPDQVAWERQFIKIPQSIRDRLKLECFLVSESGVRSVTAA